MNSDVLNLKERDEILSISNIPIIDDDTNYWFIRTNGGENFENFYFGNYVAIGWDKLNNIDFLKEGNHTLLKQHVEQFYPNESKPGNIASQILRFAFEMKIGDYVMIPGANCDRIAFGIITSDVFLYEPTSDEIFDAAINDTEWDYLKRRNVEWISDYPFERRELDPMLIPIIYSYGTIVDANPYATFINRTLYSQYFYKDEFHVIFDITKPQNISVIDFNEFINNIIESLNLYSDISKFDIDPHDLSIKASFNSPGPVEIITCATGFFIGLSALGLFINGANVNFSYNIFNLFEGEIKIETSGLLDKITALVKTTDEDNLKMKKCEAKLLESKEKLKIKKKKKKK